MSVIITYGWNLEQISFLCCQILQVGNYSSSKQREGNIRYHISEIMKMVEKDGMSNSLVHIYCRCSATRSPSSINLG